MSPARLSQCSKSWHVFTYLICTATLDIDIRVIHTLHRKKRKLTKVRKVAQNHTAGNMKKMNWRREKGNINLAVTLKKHPWKNGFWASSLGMSSSSTYWWRGGVYSRLQNSMSKDLEVEITGALPRTTNSPTWLSTGDAKEVAMNYLRWIRWLVTQLWRVSSGAPSIRSFLFQSLICSGISQPYSTQVLQVRFTQYPCAG